jgi:hypothetical protein
LELDIPNIIVFNDRDREKIEDELDTRSENMEKMPAGTNLIVKLRIHSA